MSQCLGTTLQAYTRRISGKCQLIPSQINTLMERLSCAFSCSASANRRGRVVIVTHVQLIASSSPTPTPPTIPVFIRGFPDCPSGNKPRSLSMALAISRAFALTPIRVICKQVREPIFISRVDKIRNLRGTKSTKQICRRLCCF